jgi:hypothetical protein
MTKMITITKIARLSIALFLFAGWAAAHERYQPLDTTGFASHPETYDGQLVAVRADVIAISADAKSLELFDGQSRMIITVKLTQLSKAQRSALMCNPVRHLAVYGQATTRGGRLVIDAHKVEVLSAEAKSNGQPHSEGGR